ncbi:TRPM8 channel-associated factor [Merluccius polli]|uniref:TRPM8 channel-associated factor n=1 Tax=Merluccius polli TaxID=89951 RepID=A0AA47N9N2_MERPO|nr:TRPM8 channel-associated factor [Merluccius polli]
MCTLSHHEKAYISITSGLRELDLRGPSVPSDLVLIGDHAFPLAMNPQGQVLMAASLFGRGRIVVLGHESYLTTLPALVENALNWLRGDGSENLLVGIHKSCKPVADNISRSIFQAQVLGGFRQDLGVGVYVVDTYSMAPDVKSLVKFLKAGGGLLIAGQAWSWAGQHPKENVLLGFPGNKVSSVAGIYFSEHHGEVDNLPVYPQIPSSWLAVAIGKDFKDDLEFLLQGVSEFDISGGSVASEVLIHGPLSFPIGTTSDGQAFLAGAYYGQGRVIVITHEGFMGRKELAPFWKNALHWLDEGRNGVFGIQPSLGHVMALFSQTGVNCKKSSFSKDLSVYVCTAYSNKHAEKIQQFVAEGGGLLIGGHAWHWARSHPMKNPMTDCEANHVLNRMGLSLLGSTVKAGCYKAPDPSKDNYHFRHMLRRFASHVTHGEELTADELVCLKKLGVDCANYLKIKAHHCPSYTQVLSTLTEILMKSGMPKVCDKCPAKSPKDHLLLSVGPEVYKVCPNPDALLPYLIKDNQAMPVFYDYRIPIDVNTKKGQEWISTGLYLSPGMKTYMAIPAQIVNKGWHSGALSYAAYPGSNSTCFQVQIGCQTDHLRAKELKWAPCVHERFHVTSEMMQVWNLWGGLLYLVAPPKTKVKGAVVMVQMAVPAAYYKSGVTTPADWALMRKSPAPWAELEFDNIIFSVPSDAIRDLEHPEKVAALWNRIMSGIADLAAVSHKFPRKERFVADVQISHGWMHAGYPIMMCSSVTPKLINTENSGCNNIWGFIHELGHNQQRGCWEFKPHTTECTCNLWSVYVHEEVLGINRAKAHPALKPESRVTRLKGYVKGGKKLKSWSMWVALETYLQLQEEFGWGAFKNVFAAYHDMTNIPKDNKGKMNLYTKTFSMAVEKNLCAFFKAWGWPIEAATEKELSKLPPWTNHPMARYK